ncbi:MAG: hypothetical protein JJ913_14030 [Rhizobiaceae bacterium]|nr:hypothetical protein [Rhizobiaceae bacterium]
MKDAACSFEQTSVLANEDDLRLLIGVRAALRILCACMAPVEASALVALAHLGEESLDRI